MIHFLFRCLQHLNKGNAEYNQLEVFYAEHETLSSLSKI